MEYSIQKLGKMAGVSGRTLRYYDEIGLLKPLRINSAGYRIYGPEQVKRLQEILFYREFGLELKAVGALLEKPEAERGAALRAQLSGLYAKRRQLEQLIDNLEQWLEEKEGGNIMKDEARFNGLKEAWLEENERRYGEELRERYGEETMAKSNAKMKKMSGTQFEEMNRMAEKINEALEQAVTAGLSPAGAEGQQIAAWHREWLDYTWPTYTPQAHKGLVEMYVLDERFTAYYDKRVPGCAAFLRAAVIAWLEQN